jgi:division protein CdvB (Snf7/Vps24/ESCRT-III family)
MAFLFGGKPPDPKQQMREVDRGLKKSGRELEREIRKLQMQEKKTLAEIKKLASQGQQSAAKMMAKQVVQNRKQQEKLYKGRAQLNGVSNMAKSAQASQAMMKGMATATQAMTMANAQMNPAEMTRLAMQFERQATQMETAQELM